MAKGIFLKKNLTQESSMSQGPASSPAQVNIQSLPKLVANAMPGQSIQRPSPLSPQELINVKNDILLQSGTGSTVVASTPFTPIVITPQNLRNDKNILELKIWGGSIELGEQANDYIITWPQNSEIFLAFKSVENKLYLMDFELNDSHRGKWHFEWNLKYSAGGWGNSWKGSSIELENVGSDHLIAGFQADSQKTVVKLTYHEPGGVQAYIFKINIYQVN